MHLDKVLELLQLGREAKTLDAALAELTAEMGFRNVLPELYLRVPEAVVNTKRPAHLASQMRYFVMIQKRKRSILPHTAQATLRMGL